MLKLSKTITSNEIHAEIAATEKEPKKESATMAPMTGNKLVQPLVMFEIWAAFMLFTLNTSIRYTIKFDCHPPVASVKPANAPAWI